MNDDRQPPYRAARDTGRKFVMFVGAIAIAVLALAVTNSSASGDSGSGGWLLGGTAVLATDPENPANDVIKIRTDTPPYFGTVSRKVNVKADRLDNMLEFKIWLRPGKVCTPGAPRLQLSIDLNGDGIPDANAIGDTGVNAAPATCPIQTWFYEDFTGGDGITGLGPLPSTGFATPNEEREWDLIDPAIEGPDFPGGGFTWSELELFLSSNFPNHLVCAVSLVDDRLIPDFGLPLGGTAYYDLISGGRATVVDRADIAGRGFARGCALPDDPDGPGDLDDHDKDGDVDHHDDTYDDDRRKRWNNR
jgi:hypothetical protein